MHHDIVEKYGLLKQKYLGLNFKFIFVGYVTIQ